MTWKSIRLALARTEDYPQGSSRHIYLIHLPLMPDGLVDGPEHGRHPELATVHRYWGEEPAAAGYVIKADRGWALSYERGEDDDEMVFHLESHPLRPGEYVTITNAQGLELPMRVASVEDVK